MNTITTTIKHIMRTPVVRDGATTAAIGIEGILSSAPALDGSTHVQFFK